MSYKDNFLATLLGEAASSPQADLDNLLKRLERTNKGRKSRLKEAAQGDQANPDDLIAQLQQAFDTGDPATAQDVLAQLGDLADQMKATLTENRPMMGGTLGKPPASKTLDGTELLFPGSGLTLRIRKGR